MLSVASQREAVLWMWRAHNEVGGGGWGLGSRLWGLGFGVCSLGVLSSVVSGLEFRDGSGDQPSVVPRRVSSMEE